MNRNTIDGQLLFAQNVLNNAATNPEIATALADFGYPAERITTGEELLTTARDLVNTQSKEYGEQFAATDAMNQAKILANSEYVKHLKVARIALRGDRSAATSMELDGDRKRSFSGWLSQTKAFYANALGNPTVLEALAGFGITTEKLEANQTLVIDAEQKLNDQLKEKGEAQQATLDRDAALDALNAYISDLVAISRIALEDKPQYLEMLGLRIAA